MNDNSHKKTKLWLIPIVMIILVVWFFKAASSPINSAEIFVKNMLKAPSSAKFSNERIVDEDGYGRTLVYLSVDAENSFGVPIRSNFYVVVKKKEGESGHYCDSTFGVLDANEWNAETVKEFNNWGTPQ